MPPTSPQQPDSAPETPRAVLKADPARLALYALAAALLTLAIALGWVAPDLEQPILDAVDKALAVAALVVAMLNVPRRRRGDHAA